MIDQPSLRDQALAAANTAISGAGYWLPPKGQAAAVDGVLALAAAELDASRRRAVAFVERIDAARAWARQHLDVEHQAGLLGVLRGDQPALNTLERS